MIATEGGRAARAVALIGCGYVADLYMRSFALHPDVAIVAAWDRDPARLAAFCAHWRVPAASSRAELFARLPKGGVVANLTNPAAHAAITRAALLAGHHVWSEKPLALTLDEARGLVEFADARGLLVSSAPSSVLGEAAQLLARAVREGVAGTPRLVYAELDDGYIPQAPHAHWRSDSGAPWPWADEARVGCTLEHAGYYLSWLVAMFGPVATVVAASAEVIPDKLHGGATGGATGDATGDAAAGAPDVSVAVLFFASGMVARLTCSIVAPHDHRIRVVGEGGVLEVARAWDNGAPVRFRRRLVLRRRLLEHPLGRRLRAPGATHPRVGRRGAAAMNFALGPVEMLDALAEGRDCRLSPAFSLHVTEVALAIHNARDRAGAQAMTTTCAPPEPMPWAR